MKVKIRKESSKKVHYFDKNQRDICFTQREAECTLHFLQGKTVREVGKTLGLSPRTVEFYLKNMKMKLRCRTKSEFLLAIKMSSFLDSDNLPSISDKD